MAIHITELDIERYRGIIGMDLREFNHINIFTGKNNSGKTSILEALCMVGDPIQLLSWFNISYAARFGGKSTYTELLRMFPFDDEKKISFSFNLREKIHRLDASGTEIPSRVPKDELMRLNGYMATGAPKPENREMLDCYLMGKDLHLTCPIIVFGQTHHGRTLLSASTITSNFIR